MTKTLYTAEATVTGGRADGHGRTSDGVLEVDLAPPAEFGGPGGRTNPEQLFAVGYGSCFGSAVAVVGRRHKVDPGEVRVDAQVHLHPTPEKGFALSVDLDVTLPSVDDAEVAADIVRAAHAVCPYSNATRGNIEVRLSANGAPVG
jgi:Ohr subfamily peroxiredoxin